MSIADFADWDSPGGHAAAIASTGVPLLSAPGTLISALLQPVAANGGTLTEFATFTQTGWALDITTSFPAAATIPFVEVTLTWTDGVSGTVYGEDHYLVPGSSGASGFEVLADGLARSSKLTVTVTNLDPAQAATVSLLVSQDSVTRPGDRWRWRNFADNGLNIPGSQEATLPDDEASLGYLNGVSVAASSNQSWLFGMAPGRLIQLSGFLSGAAAINANLQVRAAPGSSYASTGYLLYQDTTVAAVNATFIGPRAPIALKITNNSTAAAVNFHGMMTAQD